MSKQDDEMSDTEMWREVRKTSQHRRHNNQSRAIGLLERLYPELAITKHNNDYHLVVKFQGATIDYWPTTGKWIDRREKGRHRRGVQRLLKHLGLDWRGDGYVAGVQLAKDEQAAEDSKLNS